MDHRPDPGGNFVTDTHRRVLGHLAPPDAGYGYTVEALAARLHPDAHTPISAGDVEPLGEILDELKADGHAREAKPGIWAMTKPGFALLTGPIADEPEPGAEGSTPAPILSPDAPTPLKAAK